MRGAEDRGLRGAVARMGAPGVAAAVVAASAVIAVGWTLPGLISAWLTATPAGAAFAPDAAQDQAARLENFRKQIDGRTMFFVPARPAPPVVVEAPRDDRGPPPPSAPSTYGGPAPIAMVFDTVWFADGTKAKAGEEAPGDVQVVRLEAPWTAVVRWKGVEFTVKVFERDSVVIKGPGQKMTEGTPPEPKPAPPPEPAASPGAPQPPPADTGGGPSAPRADQPDTPPGRSGGPENNP